MNDEFGRLIGLNLLLLKLSGAIPYGRSYIVRDILAAVAFLCLSVYSVSYTFVFATRDIYLGGGLESFTLIISFVGGQARFVILLLDRERCQRMLDTCELLWSALSPKEQEIVEKYAKKTRQMTSWYLSSCILTILLYNVAALLVSSTLCEFPDIDADLRNSTNVSLCMERQLPYAFLADVQATPWYELTYVFQILSVVNVSLTCVGTDTLGPLFALIASGHFKVIKSRMEGLSAEARTAVGRLRSSPIISRVATVEAPSLEEIDRLRVCVAHHQILYQFCDELERLTNVIFLTQLLGSTYNISLVGFKLIGDDPDKFKYVTQLIIAMIQLLICNWPADILQSKSDAAGRSAYFSPWYRYPSWLRKPTSLMLLRAQRPTRLTAGKFVALSLETFASMISSAASFFTLIRSTN